MKAYKFIDEPNKPVTDGNTGLFLLKFDEKGEYITLDERLYKRMAPHFKHEEIELVEAKPETKPENTKEPEDVADVKEPADNPFACPYCGFAAGSKSGLTSHIRAKHREV